LPNAEIKLMRKTQSLNITLPDEMARRVKAKVSSGAYATESEVIREGLRALDEREAATEVWLRTEGVARYDAYHCDPRGRPAAEVFARLRRHSARRAKPAAR
jgi:putative addiction module CopG family antidote